jgi:hypothetical protein
MVHQGSTALRQVEPTVFQTDRRREANA